MVLRAMITVGQWLLVCCYLLSALVFWVGDGLPLELQLLFPFLPVMVGLSVLLWVGDAMLFQRGRWVNLAGVVLGVAVILLCYGLPSIPGLTQHNEGPVLRVLTWNAQQLGNDTAKVREAIELIREVDPDVLLLQEFGLYYKWPDVASVALDFSERTGLPHFDFTPHAGNIFGTACFSKLPISLVDTIFQLLSMTNEAKRYRIAWQGRTVNVVNAHLMSYNLFGQRNADEGLRLAEVLAARLDQAKELTTQPIDLLFGDLNAVPGDVVYQQLIAAHTDAFRGVITPTHHYFPARIDHCFHTESWEVVDAELMTDFPSDHKALMVELRPTD